MPTNVYWPRCISESPYRLRNEQDAWARVYCWFRCHGSLPVFHGQQILFRYLNHLGGCCPLCLWYIPVWILGKYPFWTFTVRIYKCGGSYHHPGSSRHIFRFLLLVTQLTNLGIPIPPSDKEGSYGVYKVHFAVFFFFFFSSAHVPRKFLFKLTLPSYPTYFTIWKNLTGPPSFSLSVRHLLAAFFEYPGTVSILVVFRTAKAYTKSGHLQWKWVRHINYIPETLIVVILGTVVSSYVFFHVTCSSVRQLSLARQGIAVVGKFDSDFLPPILPPLNVWLPQSHC